MKYVKFYGNNGYCGTDYEEYIEFSDDVTEEEINNYSETLGYENAETYEYLATGWLEFFKSEEEEEEYYSNALEYCGWDYCSEEEYLANLKNF